MLEFAMPQLADQCAHIQLALFRGQPGGGGLAGRGALWAGAAGNERYEEQRSEQQENVAQARHNAALLMHDHEFGAGER